MLLKKSSLPVDPLDKYWGDNFKDLRNYIYYRLGGGIIRIELNDVHYNIAIQEAVTNYYEYETTPVMYEYFDVDVDNGAELPAHIEPHLIKDVISSGLVSQFSQYDADNTFLSLFFPNQLVNPIFTGLDIGQYIQWQQRMDDLNNALATDFSWDVVNRRIQVYPKTLRHNTIGVFYGGILTPEEITGETWIKAYAVECAKEIWGGILEKFSGFQVASGNAVTNGASLIENAKREKDKLLTELQKRRPPMSMMQM